LFDNILENIVNKVIAFHAPIEVDGPDNIGWGGIGTQQFSVKSAYNLLLQNQSSVDGDREVLWRWRSRHSIQIFIWLVAHGHILTNYRQSRWGAYDKLNFLIIHLFIEFMQIKGTTMLA
jgi:hypothetical protein